MGAKYLQSKCRDRILSWSELVRVDSVLIFPVGSDAGWQKLRDTLDMPLKFRGVIAGNRSAQ